MLSQAEHDVQPVVFYSYFLSFLEYINKTERHFHESGNLIIKDFEVIKNEMFSQAEHDVGGLYSIAHRVNELTEETDKKYINKILFSLFTPCPLCDKNSYCADDGTGCIFN